MKVAMCSAEVVPFAKTGGLADVVGSLPLALKGVGVDCRIIMPYYKSILEKDYNRYKFKILDKNIKLPMGENVGEFFDILTAEYNSVIFYFIKNDKFFNRENLYGTPKGDYKDNSRRFCFFSKSILTVLINVKFKPDIIHLNDYHCAMTSVFLKHLRNINLPEKDFFAKTSTVFTIHNIAYQGIYSRDIMDYCGIGDRYFNIDGLEYYGKVNFMKGGILFSDKVTTVSPTYAKEILNPEYGYGIDGILKVREKDIVGIVNGIDYNIWDSGINGKIEYNYTIDSMEGKNVCKKYLIKNFFKSEKENIPILSMVTRLSEQKGIDLVVEILDLLMKEELLFIILGSGDEKYQKMLEDYRKKYKHKLSINIEYNDRLARRIYSGSDIFLMPSKYEPCGLGQLISLKYGTVPVVRNTGGLADTIIEIEDEEDIKRGGTGFKFNNYNGSEFFSSIKEAIYYYNNNSLWNRIIKNGMKSDFSWKKSAKEYKKLYLSLKK